MHAPPVYRPMLATSGVGRLRGEWAAEPKLDGWRAIVTVDPSLPQGFDVRSRNGRSLTTSVPELRGMADIGVRTVLDGEMVAVDGDNIDFYALGRRMITKRSTRTITFAAFDVLWLDGIDCTQLVYSQRRHALEMLDLAGAAWCTVPRFALEDADALLAACGRLGQEGVVLKRMDAVYVPGVRTGSWRKIKTVAWRSDHAPRRLPTAIRERIAAAELAAVAPPKDPGAISLSSPLPGTPTPRDAFEGSRMLLPNDETAPRAARLYAKDWATSRVIPHETVSDLLLVVSELATNAVCHGSPPLELTLRYREDVISGAVSDGSLEMPRRVANPDERGGRGLTLVEACTTRWGTAVHNHGKEVWFDIELASPLTAAETS